MPVHVCVALLATKAEDVDPLGRHGGFQGAGDTMDHAVGREVLLERKVPDDGFSVLDRRHQHVAA
jgi:hypothetical protein